MATRTQPMSIAQRWTSKYVEGTFDAVTAAMRGLLVAGALPVVLGGDHAITRRGTRLTCRAG